ncbi:hypothetical protein [Streptomyces sp. NPDC001380]|uniref:hypothetical protein n=1 Tax=Streptomyces sp. NPDC001380 TaxID=3364566 RepID=UPI00367B6E44
MGVLVSVRGWLECDGRQLARIKEIIGSEDQDRTYSGGWGFPARQCNFANWVFFGAQMRAGSLDRFRGQLGRVARIPASDEDGDLVTGLFLVSHDVEGMGEWQVRDGAVVTGPASGRYRYLDA